MEDRRAERPGGCLILFMCAWTVSAAFFCWGLLNDPEGPSWGALIPASFLGLGLCVLFRMCLPGAALGWLAGVCFTIPWVAAAVVIGTGGVKDRSGRPVSLPATIVFGTVFAGIALFLVGAVIWGTVRLIRGDAEE